MATQVMILGASARAAAFSVRRAGYEPVAADRFADRDLRECCHVLPVPDYPRGLVQVARQWPALPWMYTGALENEPALVDAISGGRTLWGNAGRVLREVRSPVRVADALRDAGLSVPRIALDIKDMPPDSTWLSKPLASCGGSGIRSVSRPPTRADGTVGTQGRYFQQQVDGLPCGAVFVAAGGHATLLGVTRQLVGTDWCGAAGFQYAGSIGPLWLPAECVGQLGRAGNRLAARFQLRGLFGVDAIVAGQTVWPVEVNPRYTASVELIERALGFDAFQLHVEACCRASLPQLLAATKTESAYLKASGNSTRGNPGFSGGRGHCRAAPQSQEFGPAVASTSQLPDALAYFGKAVVYATDDVITTELLTHRSLAANTGRWPRFADIPEPGTEVRTGQPILTVFADGGSEEFVEKRLRERVASVRRWLS